MDNRVIDQLRQEEKKVRIKIENLRSSIEKELSAAEADLATITGAIAYCERQAKDAAEIMVIGVNHDVAAPAPKLLGLTHKQAVIAIARQNNGIVKSGEAKRLMIRAGIMAPTKNASRMVHNAIKTSKMFDPIAPGEYRLKEANTNANGASITIPVQ
jgi:hypothetical protein